MFCTPGLSGTPKPTFAIDEPIGGFIEPHFTIESASENPQVVLVSARGAAGKSTTASQMSSILGYPIWRLENDFAVSNSSIHSLLVGYLSSPDPMKLLSEMERPALIIDSLDEAKARVSATSWTDFVASLIEYSKVANLILFGRTQTILELGADLQSENIGCSWYEISHFDNLGAGQYVDARASKVGIDVTLTAYTGARDALIGALSTADLGDESDRFVGYPPVLDAVAGLLDADRNFLGVKNRYEDQFEASNQTRILVQIVTELLERERRKINPLATDLGLGPESDCYSSHEQMLWMLSTLGGSEPPDLKYFADPTQRVEYSNRIRTFIDDHPFKNGGKWSSPVFRAYACASNIDLVTEGELLAAGHESGLLFDFFVELALDKIIDEQQFAALHSSLIAGANFD